MAQNGKKLQELMLQELRDLVLDIKQVRQSDIPRIREDVAGLKVKAAIAGGIAGLLGTGVVSLIVFVFKSFM